VSAEANPYLDALLRTVDDEDEEVELTALVALLIELHAIRAALETISVRRF
jgi:hypothetical protein